MSEQTPETTSQQSQSARPAKKAAAKKAAASSGKVTIYMVGVSYGAEAGDRKRVSAERAAELVRAGLARYPADKG